MSWSFHNMVVTRICWQMLQICIILLYHLTYKEILLRGVLAVVKTLDMSYELSFLCMDFRGIIWIFVSLETNGFCVILELSAYCLRQTKIEHMEILKKWVEGLLMK